MADLVTPQERALIDAAVAAGAVRRVPTGAHSEAVYRYGPVPGRRGWLFAVQPSRIVRKRGATASPEVNARRQRVLGLVRRGLSLTEAAEAEGISVSRASQDLRALHPSVATARAEGHALGLLGADQ